MDAKETRVIAVQVPAALADRLDALARQLERPRGWVLRRALNAWVDQEEERDRLTREALGDVDAGLVVDHREVAAWLEALEPEPAVGVATE